MHEGYEGKSHGVQEIVEVVVIHMGFHHVERSQQRTRKQSRAGWRAEAVA